MTRTYPHNLTSNEYYGGLNRRFERRAKRLRTLGYEYERIDDLNLAVFAKRCRWNSRRNRAIPATAVARMSNEEYRELLAETLTRTR